MKYEFYGINSVGQESRPSKIRWINHLNHLTIEDQTNSRGAPFINPLDTYIQDIENITAKKGGLCVTESHRYFKRDILPLSMDVKQNWTHYAAHGPIRKNDPVV